MKWILGIATVVLAIFVVGVLISMYSPSPDLAMSKRITNTANSAIFAKSPDKCSTLPVLTVHEREPDDEKGGTYTSYPADDCLRAYYQATEDPNACTMSSHPDANIACFDYMAKVYGKISYCDQRINVPTWRVDLCYAGAGDISTCALYSNNPNVYGTCVNMAVAWTRDINQCHLLLPNDTSSDQTRQDYNYCLTLIGEDKPEERNTLCEMMLYPAGTLPEKKAQCVTDTW